MRLKIYIMIAAIAAAAFLSSTATASKHVSHQKPFATMTTREVSSWLHRQQTHDKGAISWLTRHIDVLRSTRPSRVELGLVVITPRTSPALDRLERWWGDLRWYRTSLRIVTARRVELVEALSIPPGTCASCWDGVAGCESHDTWNLVTGNDFYWGLQWVPSTWDAAAARHGLPPFEYFSSHGTAPTREQQITAASDMALSNWPVCQSQY